MTVVSSYCTFSNTRQIQASSSCTFVIKTVSKIIYYITNNLILFFKKSYERNYYNLTNHIFAEKHSSTEEVLIHSLYKAVSQANDQDSLDAIKRTIYKIKSNYFKNYRCILDQALNIALKYNVHPKVKTFLEHEIDRFKTDSYQNKHFLPTPLDKSPCSFYVKAAAIAFGIFLVGATAYFGYSTGIINNLFTSSTLASAVPSTVSEGNPIPSSIVSLPELNPASDSFASVSSDVVSSSLFNSKILAPLLGVGAVTLLSIGCFRAIRAKRSTAGASINLRSLITNCRTKIPWKKVMVVGLCVICCLSPIFLLTRVSIEKGNASIERDNANAITVFTSYTTNNPARLSMSQMVVENHQKYCTSHGYKYLAWEENLAKPTLPYWSKIKGIMDLLKTPSKWIVWLDDDAVITNQSIELQKFILSHGGSNPQTHVIVTQDSMSGQSWCTDLNTGVLIVRNSRFSRRFFKELWNMRTELTGIEGTSYTYGDCPNQVCLHEQQAMHDLLRKKPKFRKHVKIIPQRDDRGIGMNVFHRFSHYDYERRMSLDYSGDPPRTRYQRGDFIAQCTGLESSRRLECVKTLIDDSNETT